VFGRIGGIVCGVSLSALDEWRLITEHTFDGNLPGKHYKRVQSNEGRLFSPKYAFRGKIGIPGCLFATVIQPFKGSCSRK
jgi:hypothetical protein